MTSKMGKVYKSEAIILKRQNVAEVDRIITAFVLGQGKLRLMAKGIRRVTSKRAPHLEVFSRISLLIHSGKTMDTITEVQPVEQYPTLRHQLERISLAYYLCELIDALLPEKQEHNDVYILLAEYLAVLDAVEEKYLLREAQLFTLKLLWTLGFMPYGKKLSGGDLQHFVENITEKRLKTPKFARQVRVK